MSQIMSGGLLILHGLIVATEKRILPHLSTIVPFIESAISDSSFTDGMGTRLACGLVSDLSTHLD